MSVSSISGSGPDSYDLTAIQQQRQQMRQTFQQLGQDLQAGDLSAAQSDFLTLQQSRPAANAPSATGSSSTANSIGADINQVSQDLQTGNVSAAQQDFATLQQALASAGHRHHHHHGGGGGASSATQGTPPVPDLQAGNTTAAQQAYASIAQLFGSSANPSSSAATTISTFA